MFKSMLLNGKRIAWSENTTFLVQVGRHDSAYKTRYRFTGDLAKALFHYQSINVGNGYKKRLLMPSSAKPCLARQTTSIRKRGCSYNW